MSAKHTPGPLVVAGPSPFWMDRSWNAMAYGVREPRLFEAAAVCIYRAGDKKGEASALADARLYAAAPELLAALKACHADTRVADAMDPELYDMVCDAIAKAKGSQP